MADFKVHNCGGFKSTNDPFGNDAKISGWGAIEFRYTIKHVEQIFKLLQSNRFNTNKVFRCVWEKGGCFDHLDREYASIVLDLVQTVKSHAGCAVNDPRQIWEAMKPDA